MPDRQINPAFAQAVREAFCQVPYFQLLGMSLEKLTYGRSEFRLPAQRKHLNPYQGVHGGVVASLLDATCAWAAYSCMASEMALTTVELKVNFLAPGHEGSELRSVGTCVKGGRTLGVASGQVVEHPSGRLVGHATATVIALDRPFSGVLAGLPPKFLPE